MGVGGEGCCVCGQRLYAPVRFGSAAGRRFGQPRVFSQFIWLLATGGGVGGLQICMMRSFPTGWILWARAGLCFGLGEWGRSYSGAAANSGVMLTFWRRRWADRHWAEVVLRPFWLKKPLLLFFFFALFILNCFLCTDIARIDKMLISFEFLPPFSVLPPSVCVLQ